MEPTWFHDLLTWSMYMSITIWDNPSRVVIRSGLYDVATCNLSVNTFETLGKLRSNYFYHLYQRARAAGKPLRRRHAHMHTRKDLASMLICQRNSRPILLGFHLLLMNTLKGRGAGSNLLGQLTRLMRHLTVLRKTWPRRD